MASRTRRSITAPGGGAWRAEPDRDPDPPMGWHCASRFNASQLPLHGRHAVRAPRSRSRRSSGTNRHEPKKCGDKKIL